MMVRGAEGLECFDEAEDWAVACQHYSMTCAATEDMATLLNASGCVEHCFRDLEVGHDACTAGGPVCTEARGEVDGGEAGAGWIGGVGGGVGALWTVEMGADVDGVRGLFGHSATAVSPSASLLLPLLLGQRVRKRGRLTASAVSTARARERARGDTRHIPCVGLTSPCPVARALSLTGVGCLAGRWRRVGVWWFCRWEAHRLAILHEQAGGRLWRGRSAGGEDRDWRGAGAGRCHVARSSRAL